ncbi:HD domain-containing protein [Hymenobacter sp. BT683]|uniref:HD domain-containing protein n=1 Tax=Hymenobacter jeongseonensis TaxID=2791027 RepID=A0ABS0ID87_9BACT|nr:Pycsar system effector family protein [Hymenobacter jeongseonensis]MBF9236309.1 HD domain-containing protein [Hymenobacter jeongseonensis]
MEELTPDTVETPPAATPAEPTDFPPQNAASRPAAPATETAEQPTKAKASPLVKAAQAYVTELFAQELPAKLTYHSLRHTETVVKECRALAPAAGLSPEETEALLLAAWFHDTGYLDVYDGHEFRSMERARAWLTERGADAKLIEQVSELINATHRDSASETKLQKLLTDADMSNLARDDFRSNAELLRTEWELVLGKTYSNTEWAELQLNFMLEHKYESEAGKDRYGKDFKENVAAQREQLKKTEKKKKKKSKEQNDTFADPKRGVETMFRTMYNNHIKLSDMADKKASMMISLNAVLLSVIITYLGAKSSALGPAFTRNPVLAIPMSILLLTSLASVVTAILSAQPDVTSFKWLKKSPEVATNRRVNLLFFGNFTKLSLDNFQDGIRELMRQKEGLYTNMVTDVYYLGEVLSRKYNLLRTSYSVFMVGLILTVLSFIIVLMYKS